MANKSALVTGASAGLGRQIAIDLSKAGYDVFITGRNEKELSTTRGMLESNNVSGTQVADMSKKEDIYRLLESVAPDILINCAGVFPNDFIENTSVDIFDLCFAINVRAPFILMKHLLPKMKEKGWGRVINIGSSSAYAGFAGSATYCSSKHALLGLSRSAFNEYKGDNVRVLSVSPGSLKTKMGEKVKNQIYDTFIEPSEISKFIIDLIEYDGNMVCEEVRLNRLLVQ